MTHRAKREATEEEAMALAAGAQALARGLRTAAAAPGLDQSRTRNRIVAAKQRGAMRPSLELCRYS